MGATTLTIGQIIRVLAVSDKYAIIGGKKMTNFGSLDCLFEEIDQDLNMNVVDNGDHLIIWDSKATSHAQCSGEM